MGIKFKSRLKHKATIDITSLIDLVFLLVAFFMVTSSLSSQSAITVHLPRAKQSADYTDSSLVISVNSKNEIYLNDVRYSSESLVDEFIKRRESLADSTVVIRGDRKSDYEIIVDIMDKLNRAGIPKFTLATVR